MKKEDQDLQQDSDGSALYENLFAEFSNSIEKWMIRLAKSLAILLLAIQLLLLIPGVRHLLVRVERLEGDPFESGLETRNK